MAKFCNRYLDISKEILIYGLTVLLSISFGTSIALVLGTKNIWYVALNSIPLLYGFVVITISGYCKRRLRLMGGGQEIMAKI